MAHYLVVGGTSGIGLETVKKLKEEGHDVTVMSRNERDLPGGVTWKQLDVTDDDINIELDSLDGLVYAPGTINLKPFRALKDKDFRADFEVNVLGAVKVIQAVEKLLRKSDNGSVVLFSTVAVAQGMPYHASVAAAKGAVEGLTKSLAAEMAPKIRFNVLAPSVTDTPLASSILGNDDKKERSAERHPLKKVGSAAEVAAFAAFLLSKDASWISGQVMGIDGGMSTLRSL